jgi:hypothetical protein
MRGEAPIQIQAQAVHFHRENHRTLSSWVIPQFLFANGACLAAAIAVAVLTLLLASANAAPGEERVVAGISLEFNNEDGTLYIDWSGPSRTICAAPTLAKRPALN